MRVRELIAEADIIKAQLHSVKRKQQALKQKKARLQLQKAQQNAIMC